MSNARRWRMKLSQGKEAGLAKRVGGVTTPGSGNQTFNKGDVKTEIFLLEHKATLSQKSYTIKVSELSAIENKALKKGLIPALCFELVGVRGKYAVVPEHVLVDYIRYVRSELNASSE